MLQLLELLNALVRSTGVPGAKFLEPAQLGDGGHLCETLVVQSVTQRHHLQVAEPSHLPELVIRQLRAIRNVEPRYQALGLCDLSPLGLEELADLSIIGTNDIGREGKDHQGQD